MALALEGIKVIDVSQVAAVPMAARHLADFGADVIHVENPWTGDSARAVQTGTGLATGAPQPPGFKYYWENKNRNKRSITIDVSKESGREILYQLVKEADVYLTNMRPFELEKFKLEYSTLSQLNPKLVYGSFTGYGKKGAERNSPGYDHTAYWPRAGLAHRVAVAARLSPEIAPSSFVPAFGDSVSALALAFGIMMALFVRDRTGVGQKIDVSLFQIGVYQNSWDICASLITGRDCAPIPPREEAPNPLMMVYQTKDKRWLVLCMPESDRYWPRFCGAIGREDLERDPRFDSFENRKQNHTALFHILEEVFVTKTLDEWRPRLNEAALSWGPYQNFTEVIKDPQARANNFFVAYDHPTHGRVEVVANPVNLSKTPATIRMPAPEFGQHTEEILLELGYTWPDIARFKQEKIIA